MRRYFRNGSTELTRQSIHRRTSHATNSQLLRMVEAEWHVLRLQTLHPGAYAQVMTEVLVKHYGAVPAERSTSY